MELRIFVEGDTDKRLIEDYLKYLKINILYEVIYTGGKDKISTQIPTIRRFIDQGFQVSIIFDADNNIESRTTELKAIKTAYNIEFDIFLFPNNSESGDIEDLLLNIYNSKYQDIFDCLQSYENCLKQNKTYKIPIKKGKIYGFLDAVLSEKEEDNAKDKKRDFLKYDHWDLDHEYLNPLKQFLLKYNV